MPQTDAINTRPFGNQTAELLCPRCGEALLHHTGVTVYDRREDAATVTRTRVTANRTTVDAGAANEGNPSDRRDGLVIDFECENCGDAPLQLRLAQHKGTTEISWRFEPA